MAIKRAISIRQPWAELILRGEKPYEYRNGPTKVLNERVYIYASATMQQKERDELREMGLQPGDLPTGVLVGTVEFESCSPAPRRAPRPWRWKIKEPRRLARPKKPAGRPLVMWFYPFPD